MLHWPKLFVVRVGLKGGAAGQIGGLKLFAGNVAQQAGGVRVDVEEAAFALNGVAAQLDFPGRDMGEGLKALILKAETTGLLVVPNDLNLTGAGLIGLFHAHAGEPRGIHGRSND